MAAVICFNLFGESVSLIDFIKVLSAFEFCLWVLFSLRVLARNFSLLIFVLFTFYVSLLNGRHAALELSSSSRSSLKAVITRIYSNLTADWLSSAKKYSFVQLLNFCSRFSSLLWLTFHYPVLCLNVSLLKWPPVPAPAFQFIFKFKFKSGHYKDFFKPLWQQINRHV